MSNEFKVCCIASLAEARLAVNAGASAVGLVSAMPSGPGVIDAARIVEIATHIAPPVETFLLTALQHAEAIVAQHARCRTTTLQLVDAVPPNELAALRHALPGVKLVQVIHVLGDASIEQALAIAPQLDALRLDSGNPSAAVRSTQERQRTPTSQP
jgi:phosphoribosylanthranilate isomerase